MATQVAMPKMIGFKFKSIQFCNSVAMIKELQWPYIKYSK